MIVFKNLQANSDVFANPVVIGAYNIVDGEMIAICRDFNTKEIEAMKESGFAYAADLDPEELSSEDPSQWDCWEVVLQIDDEEKLTAIRKLIASQWVSGWAVLNLIK